jgi:hypothetical protein
LETVVALDQSVNHIHTVNKSLNLLFLNSLLFQSVPMPKVLYLGDSDSHLVQEQALNTMPKYQENYL